MLQFEFALRVFDPKSVELMVTLLRDNPMIWLWGAVSVGLVRMIWKSCENY